MISEETKEARANLRAEIGQRIKHMRLTRGLSQLALGLEIGADHNSVYLWEAGKTFPEVRMLPALARFLGVTTDWLLGVGE